MSSFFDFSEGHHSLSFTPPTSSNSLLSPGATDSYAGESFAVNGEDLLFLGPNCELPKNALERDLHHLVILFAEVGIIGQRVTSSFSVYPYRTRCK